jgi:hypothetical protein
MSRSSDRDAPLDEATLRALRAAGDLLPTSVAEVESAEAGLPELELPPGLQSYRGRPRSIDNARQLREPPRRSRQVLAYGIAAVAGAAAAAAALSFGRPLPPAPATSAGGELVKHSANKAPPPVPLSLEQHCGHDCCAGAACEAATDALRSCPSGIRCASCAADNVGGGPYRLRIGAVILNEAGQAQFPRSAALDLCVVPNAGEAQCLPALPESGSEGWRLLKVVTPLQDLLTGLTIELRKHGEPAVLASWRHIVSPSADILCKGLAIQLAGRSGTASGATNETLGRLSVFVEPTHFVELSRAARVPELLERLHGFEIRGISPRIYETARPGDERFALVLGPLDKRDADALRWQVLDHGLDAELAQGLDYLGSPRPLP